MTISQRLPRAIVAAVIGVVLVLFALIQLASMSFMHAPATLSAMIPTSFGRAVYHALDRIAPAAYVEETLAEDALARGDLDAAQQYAVRVPAGGRRDDLLGRVADARGEGVLAREYYFVAPDVDRMQKAVMALAKSDAPAALALEMRFGDRLAALRTHPDALAESYNITANLYDWLREYKSSLEYHEKALALAPLDLKYLLGAANEAYVAGENATAKRYFMRGLDVNPASGDCLAGLGLIALREGDRAQARAYAARARAADPHAPTLASLDAALR